MKKNDIEQFGLSITLFGIIVIKTTKFLNDQLFVKHSYPNFFPIYFLKNYFCTSNYVSHRKWNVWHLNPGPLKR